MKHLNAKKSQFLLSPEDEKTARLVVCRAVAANSGVIAHRPSFQAFARVLLAAMLECYEFVSRKALEQYAGTEPAADLLRHDLPLLCRTIVRSEAEKLAEVLAPQEGSLPIVT